MDIREQIDKIKNLNQRVDGQISNISTQLKKMKAWKLVKKDIAFLTCTLAIAGAVFVSAKTQTTKVYRQEELVGATLVLKDSNDYVVDKWITTLNPHYINSLNNGVYTLTEVEAPKGYSKTDEVISFEINEDTNKKNIALYNYPSIMENSKADISDSTYKNEISQNKKEDYLVSFSVMTGNVDPLKTPEIWVFALAYNLMLMLVDLTIIEKINRENNYIPYTSLLGFMWELEKLRSLEHIIKTYKDNREAKKEYRNSLIKIREMLSTERELFVELEDFINEYNKQRNNMQLDRVAEYLNEIAEILKCKDEYLDKANVKKYVRS